jgi:predicted HNH restriction endonuclease
VYSDGVWQHRLTKIDTTDRTAYCAVDGWVTIRQRGGVKGGWRCNRSDRVERSAARRKAYRKHVGDRCERCGFEPEDLCQLDVHHLDGNHANNASTNLQTVCANCHRVITKTFAVP